MIHTRAALADKIDALEDKVATKVRAVKSKVEGVKDSIRHAGDMVKRSFDLPYQVRQHPWPALGVSVVAGLILGSITRDRDLGEDRKKRDSDFSHGANTLGALDDLAKPPAKPGMFADELRSLRHVAVGAMMSLVRNGLRQTFPGIAPQTDRVIDGMTRKLGGEPVRDLFEASAE